MIKHIVKLKQRSNRDRSGEFVIEGHLEISRAIASNLTVKKIFFSKNLFSNEDNTDLFFKNAASLDIKIQEVSENVFNKIAYRENPDGILAIAEKWTTPLTDIELTNNPLILVAEGIEKPGNLGALIRTAEAVGSNALILTENVIDLFNPNVIRTSRGLIFGIQIIITDNNSCKDFFIQAKHSTCCYDTSY